MILIIIYGKIYKVTRGSYGWFLAAKGRTVKFSPVRAFSELCKTKVYSRLRDITNKGAWMPEVPLTEYDRYKSLWT